MQNFEKNAAGKQVSEFLDFISKGRRVLDNKNITKAAERELGRKVQGKPGPGIFLVALASITDSLADGGREVKPDQLLGLRG